MYYNTRWYDPALGRFVQADILIPQPGNPIAWDRYGYVMNNPVRYIDPSGHMAWEGGGGGVSGCTYSINGHCPTTKIDSDFSDTEEELIQQVLAAYAQLFGGYDAMNRNLTLTRINQDWVNPDIYAFFEGDSVTLPFGWYSDSIYQNPNGTFTISIAPTDIEALLKFPSGSLPTEELRAKFVLAHEMSHALANGNPEVLSSFQDNVDLPWAFFAGLGSNPIISRNAGRSGFSQEVFADVIAASLYSPKLLNHQMTFWIQAILPGLLH